MPRGRWNPNGDDPRFTRYPNRWGAEMRRQAFLTQVDYITGEHGDVCEHGILRKACTLCKRQLVQSRLPGL